MEGETVGPQHHGAALQQVTGAKSRGGALRAEEEAQSPRLVVQYYVEEAEDPLVFNDLEIVQHHAELLLPQLPEHGGKFQGQLLDQSLVLVQGQIGGEVRLEGGQHLGHGLAEVAGKDHDVVVRAAQVVPGAFFRVALGVVGEEDGLAVAHPGADDDEPLLGVVEPLDELLADQEIPGGGGGLDLRFQEAVFLFQNHPLLPGATANRDDTANIAQMPVFEITRSSTKKGYACGIPQA